MIIMKHRRNTIEELKETPQHLGVEVDIRTKGSELIIHHDPYADGISFVDWLEHYHHKTLILNVKEEGLEDRLVALMQKKQIKDFFFIDQTFPFLIRTLKKGEKRCAVRVSEYESVETALRLKGQAEWVWADCFTHFSLKKEEAKALKDAGFKICLVSPELQGRKDPEEITQIKKQMHNWNLSIDGVCTKIPELWV